MPDIQEMFKEAWSTALAGVNVAEQEAEKILTRLGFSPDEVKRHAREFGERLASQRKDVEKAIDDAVRRAAGRFRIPTQEDLSAVQKRLDAVATRLDQLAKEKGLQ